MSAEAPAPESRESMETDLIELFRRLSHDDDLIPPKPDLLYLFGQTKENQAAVLDVAKDLGTDVPVAIVGHDGTEASGFSGYSAWKKELMQRGIADDHIVGITGSFTVDPSSQALKGNTFTEAQALVRYAKEHGLKTVVVAASLWHMPRSFISAVSVALREYPELRLYLMHGKELAWDEASVHSQGISTGRRLDFIDDEMRRIVTYHAKGDLVSPREVLSYLDRRDQV